MHFLSPLNRLIRLLLPVLVGITLLGSSSLQPGKPAQRVRAFTRDIEFDFAGWMLGALQGKLMHFTLGVEDYLAPDARKRMMLDYLELVRQLHGLEAQVRDLYSDPAIADPVSASAGLRRQIAELQSQRQRYEPVAEAVLQGQIGETAAGLGLTLGGQPVPPVLYHSTPLPLALIVSPRDVIRQDADISLDPELPIELQAALEERVDRALNVSSLVESIGGVGVYPTMVYQTTSLDWLCEVVAHEWVHNFLTLRPLGANYLSSPEMRIINETTAALAGKEIGRVVLERYYPELVPPPPPPAPAPHAGAEVEPAAPVFDYRAEMHTTRVTVDGLLAENEIEAAETYMEQRRVLFWDQGYHNLRKLNQAYFAFHGAYADQPGGAAGAGEDPVGSAVRALRASSPSLGAFLKRISWVTSFAQLQQMVDKLPEIP